MALVVIVMAPVEEVLTIAKQIRINMKNKGQTTGLDHDDNDLRVGIRDSKQYESVPLNSRV